MSQPPAADDAFALARQEMVERQLRGRGIRDQRVIAAMARVPRERFVPPSLADLAYSDQALPIDCEQTISQPLIVALMSEALRLSGHERVLEVGTGSGYQSAVLAEMLRGGDGGQVITIERHLVLAEQSRERLAALGHRRVRVVTGDGMLGFPQEAPFNGILVAAAGSEPPPALLDQLAEGGRLVMPVGGRAEQDLRIIEKTEAGDLIETSLGGCRFVPLLPGLGE